LVGDKRKAQGLWKQGINVAEKMQANYVLAKLHHELGLRMEDSAHAERAELLFARAGAAQPRGGVAMTTDGPIGARGLVEDAAFRANDVRRLTSVQSLGSSHHARRRLSGVSMSSMKVGCGSGALVRGRGKQTFG
jgi:hypothetical protein